MPNLKYPPSDHYDGTLFHNQNRETDVNKGLKDILKWKLTETQTKWPDFVNDNLKPNFATVLEANDAAVTFINHACDFVQVQGLNFITDPTFSKRTSPMQFAGPKRHRAPGATMNELPKVDVVLISHNHYDHLDLPSVLQLEKLHHPKFLVPLGNKDLLVGNGIQNVTELDWWESHSHGPNTFTLVPMQHWSSRTPFDRCKTLWGGFTLTTPELKILFAGDTGYGPQFKEIEKRIGGMDISLLPIGAYAPRWFMKDHHMNPQEAVLAHLDLKSKLSIALHFGTFQLTDEGMEEPVTELAKALDQARIAPERFPAPKNGQTIFYRRAAL